MNAADNSARIQRLRFTSFAKKDAAAEQLKKESVVVAPPPPPAPPPMPTYSEMEMMAAKSEGYGKGFTDGQATAQAKLNQEALDRDNADRMLMEVIANRITFAAEEHQAYRTTVETHIGKLAMAVARKIAGDAVRREPYASAEALLKTCTSLMLGEERITIFVPPARAEGLRQRAGLITPLLQGFEGELIVTEDETLSDQDCRVAWTNGAAERNTEALWREIETIIAKTPVNAD